MGRHKGYRGDDYEALFSVPSEEGTLEGLRRGHKRVACYRTRDIIAGDVREIESFPIWNTKAEVRAAKAAQKRQRMVQEKLNEKNLKKKITRRANASFTREDLFATFTYEGEAPDEARARRDMQKYIRNVRGWRQRRGLPEMQYIYSIEFGDAEGKRKRIHAHILMTGMDREAAEALWPHGRANTRRLQPDEHGLARIVAYMLKAKRSTRRIGCSRNIQEPVVRERDKLISRRRVERLAAGMRETAQEVLEGMYPGWRYVSCEVKQSEFVAGAYVYAQMIREADTG